MSITSRRLFLSIFIVLHTSTLLAAAAQEQSPVLEFPREGLDDMAAYRNYQTRFFRDASSNTIQVVLNQEIGRVVNLWADAANESISFSVRDSSGAMPRLSWRSPGATASTVHGLRILEYTLSVHAPVFDVGHLLLGSMRKERDFQYDRRELLPFDSLPPVEGELIRLVANLSRLPETERRVHLSLLHATSINEVAARLRPHAELSVHGAHWIFSATQSTFDGQNHFLLELSGDTARSRAVLVNTLPIIRARDGSVTDITVRIGSDSPALTPLTLSEIFSPEFEQFYGRKKAEAEHAGGHAGRSFDLLDRQVKSVELLSSKEKLLAGLPNYATYFGRDMMMSAMMMEPILRPAMQEHVIAAVLRKLSPEGKVSHEEALGGQAIRENAGAYNTLVETYLQGNAQGTLAEARSVLSHLQLVRENYQMVDETFQLPVIVGRYLVRGDVPAKEKKAFLLDTLGGTTRLARLMKNLRYVEQCMAPFAAQQDVMHLVSFQRHDDGAWASGSWRDSGAGYAGGRFAMDVNAIWVPSALEGMKAIFSQLHGMGLSAAQLDLSVATAGGSHLRRYLQNPAALDGPISRWRRARDFFVVTLQPDEVRSRVQARLAALPAEERAYWEKLLPAAAPDGPLPFLALSLDSVGRPIPVMNTDPATWLFLGNLAGEVARGGAAASQVHDVLHTFVLPYPVGLFVEGLGTLVANDAYATPDVWEHFERDQYHSPRVVWGREVNLILLGAMKLLRGIRITDGTKDMAAFASAARDLGEVLNNVRTAVDTSGMKQNELWSYTITGDTLRPARYTSTCDIQLWNLTDLAVQFEFDRLRKK